MATLSTISGQLLQRQRSRYLRWMIVAGVAAISVTVLAAVAKDPWFGLVALVLWFLTWNRWAEHKRVVRWLKTPVYTNVRSSSAGVKRFCSFCGKPQDDVRILISSPANTNPTYICDECVNVCKSILDTPHLQDEQGRK